MNVSRHPLFWGLTLVSVVLFAGVSRDSRAQEAAGELSTVLKLRKGWNMVSLPLVPAERSRAAVFPEEVLSVWRHAGFYQPVAEDEDLVPGNGYWAFAVEDVSVPVTGTPLYEHEVHADASGWVMVGGCSLPAHSTANQARIRAQYRYDAETATYAKTGDEGRVRRGQAHWLYLDEPATVRTQSGWDDVAGTPDAAHLRARSDQFTRLSQANAEFSLTCNDWQTPRIAPGQVRLFLWREGVPVRAYSIGEEDFEASFEEVDSTLSLTVVAPSALLADAAGSDGDCVVRARVMTRDFEVLDSSAVAVDTVSPAAFVHSPIAGAVLRGNAFRFDGRQRNGNDAVRRRWRILDADGAVVHERTTPAQGEFSFRWEDVDVPDGVYTLECALTDAGGNVGTDRVQFLVNNGDPLPPELTRTEIDDFVALLSRRLRALGTGSVSFGLFREGHLARSPVSVKLLDGDAVVSQAEQTVQGRGRVDFSVPDIPAGSYEIEVSGSGFSERGTVQVEEAPLLLAETDKPMYKPGQTVHGRIVTLNPDLKPVPRTVVVEVQDAEGIKVFRKELATDEYGMVGFELPLSTEPNLGVWTIAARSGEASAQLDIRVEKYVLPKYEVSARLDRDWFRVDEPITGAISAEYSFGKPVKGELVIEASRYVGAWEVFQTLTAPIDGDAQIELDAPGYVAGVPGAGGNGNVSLEITVTEANTGYSETVTELLTVSESDLNVHLIPEGRVLKPGLPFHVLVVTETPGNEPRNAEVTVRTTYITTSFHSLPEETTTVVTEGGVGLLTLTPPSEVDGVETEGAGEFAPLAWGVGFEDRDESPGISAALIEAEAGDASASKVVRSASSPSGNFIHITQTDGAVPAVGAPLTFAVHTTAPRSTFYYEVCARGRVLFSSWTDGPEITFNATPPMAPSAKLVVYQLLPNSELAADFLPFQVDAPYPHTVSADFDVEQARPGEDVGLSLQTEGAAKVGLCAVDKSVFILARNRLNLHQVFAELERLYMAPQVEIHPEELYQTTIETAGATEVFEEADLLVLSNQTVPDGRQVSNRPRWRFGGGGDPEWRHLAAVQDGGPVPAEGAGSGHDLAEVQRVRQFFPETWIWQDVLTDDQGAGELALTVPDTITTWMLRAVALSPEHGFGVAEDSLTAFQPFFVKLDLPYEAVRGEEFPLRVAVYNYLDQSQQVRLDIQDADWFDLLDDSTKTVSVGANGTAAAQFRIRPTKLGTGEVHVAARTPATADAMIKTMRVVPEGIQRERVETIVLKPGQTRELSTDVPIGIVTGSDRAYAAVTGSYLTQSMEGLDELLRMPFGCGEQNMMCLAPDIYITRYLRETGQVKPDILAKAELMMITGYQRQLTYRHDDGSFSAFGQQDDTGSLWLTAFVLKVFSEADGLMYVDPAVPSAAKEWIVQHQAADGAFDPVGFVCHEEMMGGVAGKPALTAFVALALQAAGGGAAADQAVAYLEDQLEGLADVYTTTLVACALERSESALKADAYAKLMALAEETDEGLRWPAGRAAVEATGYALMALLERGDILNARRAARWLTSRRNAYGGFSTTQDTVVGLDALCRCAEGRTSNTNVALHLSWTDGEDTIHKEIAITPETIDVLQTVPIPSGRVVEAQANGQGEAVVQVVRRYNLPTVPEPEQPFRISVDYDTTSVEVDDLVTISVEAAFVPGEPIESGMVVLDISIPTGFAAEEETLEAVLEGDPLIKRYDVAGRKVIWYIDNLKPNESVAFSFKVRACYPVKAKAVSSQAYSYYKPDLKGETLSPEMTVE